MPRKKKQLIDITTPENLYKLMHSSDVQDFISIIENCLDKLDKVSNCPEKDFLARKKALEIWKGILGTINSTISSKDNL